MRRTLVLACTLSLAGFTSAASASEAICFINNSSQDFSLRYNDSIAVSVPANGGDQNKCVSVDTINGNSVDGDSAASYYEPGWGVSNANFSLDVGSIIYPDGSSVQMKDLPSLAGLTFIQPVFLNPVIGEGSFYWANPWRNISGRTITADSITWEENDKWCNNVTCFYHQRGDDGIYRVWMIDHPTPPPAPDPTCDSNPMLCEDWPG